LAVTAHVQRAYSGDAFSVLNDRYAKYGSMVNVEVYKYDFTQHLFFHDSFIAEK